MKGLSEKKCVPCEGGVPPLSKSAVNLFRKQLHKDWQVAKDYKSLKRSLKFKDFYRTMSFVNAVAHVANTEDHHPDLEAGYDYCRITYSTHSIGGLSVNDFICAAKIDRL
ncbi:MAG TPA: 4a-hydroxytetrahydrobiopterin dehydratase [Steroidobacteraceae bacterium]